MKLKIFTGATVEERVNAWLDTPGNRIIKIHVSSSMYIEPNTGSGTTAVAVAIEYDPL